MKNCHTRRMKIINNIIASLYIIVLFLLFGCATTTNTANKEEYHTLVNELLVDMHKSEERIEFHEISDLQHRVKVRSYMAYVDYLHLVNNKNKVVKSYKLNHSNNDNIGEEEYKEIKKRINIVGINIRPK